MARHTNRPTSSGLPLAAVLLLGSGCMSTTHMDPMEVAPRERVAPLVGDALIGGAFGLISPWLVLPMAVGVMTLDFKVAGGAWPWEADW